MSEKATTAGGSVAILGAGYTGGRLVREALARGMRVCALTRNPATAGELRAVGADVVCADLREDSWHARVPQVQDLVVNCVGAGGGGPGGYRRSYLEGQESINRWFAGGAAAGVFVYTGSIGVYPQDDGSLVDENAPAGGHSEYADLLLATEQRVLEAPRAAGRRYVLRLAGIYGPGRHFLLDRLLAGGALPGDPRGILNAIHVGDVCAAVWSVHSGTREGTDGVYNVVDDCPAERGLVAEWLARRLGRETPRFDPETAGTRGRRPRNRRIDNRKFRETFGWKPRYPSFREGYAALLEGRCA